MSRHWRPSGKIVRIRPLRRGPWTRAGDYLDLDVAAPRRVAPFVLGAVLLGLAAAGVISWTGKSVRSAKPDAPIEWNAVQAVPTREPDAEDIAWQQRAMEPLPEPVIASTEGARHPVWIASPRLAMTNEKRALAMTPLP